METYRVYETMTYVHTVEATDEDNAIQVVMDTDSQGKLLDGSDFEVERI